MRGDPPHVIQPFCHYNVSTPHARGSTPPMYPTILEMYVYPACAGIHLTDMKKLGTYKRLPRMRGDPPWRRNSDDSRLGSTPHARGSTLSTVGGNMYVRVYPACAGIHPSYSKPTRLNQRLPRMRGDPPNGYSGTLEMALSTPHARGSTLVRPFRDLRSGVYPACAGIHPLESGKRLFGKGLPRMRGDPPREEPHYWQRD